MANIREIKTRMNSIEDTLKITNAMYLISSSKLKKARKQLDATTPYFEMLQASLLDIMAHTPDLQHIFLNKRKKEHPKKGYLVMTADRGLAGAYNHNITKMAEENINEDDKLFVIGYIIISDEEMQPRWTRISSIQHKIRRSTEQEELQKK